GENGFARRKIDEAPFDPELVTLENSGIALDRLHQRAGLSLLRGRALAEAAALQSGSELIKAVRRGGEIGVERQVGLDAIELLDHAGERAHMLAIALDGGLRGHRAIAAAGHDQFGAAAELDAF